MDRTRRVADVADLSADDTFLFRVHDGDDEREAIALLSPAEDGEPPAERVVCWTNACRHFTHIALDKGSGAPVRDGELVCANHGAMFDAATGECTHGPCEGASLAPIGVTVEDGGVYLEDGYGFAGCGGIETDPADLSSTSNVEF